MSDLDITEPLDHTPGDDLPAPPALPKKEPEFGWKITGSLNGARFSADHHNPELDDAMIWFDSFRAGRKVDWVRFTRLEL